MPVNELCLKESNNINKQLKKGDSFHLHANCLYITAKYMYKIANNISNNIYM